MKKLPTLFPQLIKPDITTGFDRWRRLQCGSDLMGLLSKAKPSRVSTLCHRNVVPGFRSAKKRVMLRDTSVSGDLTDLVLLLGLLLFLSVLWSQVLCFEWSAQLCFSREPFRFRCANM